MAISQKVNSRSAQGHRPVSKVNKIPAPVKGIDATTILAEGDPLHSIYSYNFLPREYGLRVRRGYQEHQIELSNGNPLGVHTIIPYGGNDADTTNDRLFAVTNEGIWDVTVSGAAPILKFDFLAGVGDTTFEAGYGVYVHFKTDANDNILYYADSRNGLFVYTETGDTWAEATGIIGGVDLSLVNFVMVHKDQLWLVERDSGSAWYLPAGNIAGGATEFILGTKFKHGSNVAGLFSWTIDGGEGVDDYFVAVSRSGDVILYKGTDPSDVLTWETTGQWFIGAIPKGPKFATQDGGSLYILSIYGLISLDEIVVGVDGKNINAETETKKISLLIRNNMDTARLENNWQVSRAPAQSSLIINAPQQQDGQYIQYVRNTTTDGWGLWRNVIMLCFDEWNGVVYFGTEDSRIMSMDVDVDNKLLTPPVEGDNGSPIKWSVLTTFQDYNAPALFKRGKLVRPQFLAKLKPAFTCAFRYDYNLTEVMNTETFDPTSFGLWDISDWDAALWDSGQPRGFQAVCGGGGIGRTVAIALAGESLSETTLISWDVTWDAGGPL